MDFVPLGVVDLPIGDIQTGIHIPIEAQVLGVGGWIVFGNGIEEPFSGRFSTPEQSVLAPRAAKYYNKLPVSSLGKLNNITALSGLVLLKAGNDIEIATEEREIGGEDREAIVVRLLQGQGANVFDTYKGPCGGRPETGTCQTPNPIEFINTIPPDCDGNIRIEFSGCAITSKMINVPCGFVIDCDKDIADACVRGDRLPDNQGNLPNDYDDACAEPESDVSISEEPPGPGPGPGPGPSASSETCSSLPYTENFEDGIAQSFEVKRGGFVFVDDDPSCTPEPSESLVSESASSLSSPSSEEPFTPTPGFICPFKAYATEAAISSSTRNISVWNDCAILSTVDIKTTAQVRILTPGSGALGNGGVITNYRPRVSIPSQFEYWIAELNVLTASFVVQRFNGTLFQPLVSAPVSGAALGDWYEIAVSVEPGTIIGQVAYTAVLTGITDPSVSVTLGPLLINNWFPDDGLNGVGSNRSRARFASITFEDIP